LWNARAVIAATKRRLLGWQIVDVTAFATVERAL